VCRICSSFQPHSSFAWVYNPNKRSNWTQFQLFCYGVVDRQILKPKLHSTILLKLTYGSSYISTELLGFLFYLIFWLPFLRGRSFLHLSCFVLSHPSFVAAPSKSLSLFGNSIFGENHRYFDPTPLLANRKLSGVLGILLTKEEAISNALGPTSPNLSSFRLIPCG